MKPRRAGAVAICDDNGLGLIEIVISMFLLALLAVTFLPLIIQSLSLTRSNVTLATSTQLVSQQLDLARAQESTCEALTAFASTAVPTTTDQRGVVLQPQRAATCPSTYPGTAGFTASVVQSGSTLVISSATTLIYVSEP
ncbi:MAG: type IV pilus modification PilV family protein [Lacisediminihabitans sp.]